MISTDEFLERMDEILDQAPAAPLRAGKVIVNADELRKLIDDIRLHLPQEIRQARAIVAERNDIVADARRDAESITRQAEERARKMIDKDDVKRRAQIAASEIRAQAQTQAREIRKAATDYSENIMRTTEDIISQKLAELRQARQNLRASVRETGATGAPAQEMPEMPDEYDDVDASTEE